MPRGDRVNLSTLVGLATAAVIAVCVIGFTWTVSARQAARTEQARHYASGYADSTQSRIERACRGSDPASVRQCVAEQIQAARESQRAEYDLSAQQSMSDWAAVMAALTLATFIATAIGVWFVKRTLDATLEAVEDTSNATQLMRDANLIARQANERSLRAYIALDKIDIEPQVVEGETRFYSIIVNWKNYGSTPALAVKSHVSLLHWHGSKLPPWFPFFDIPSLWGPSDQPANFFSPGQTIEERIVNGFSSTHTYQIKRGWRRVFVWGWVEYQDIFGKSHRTSYCRRIRIVNGYEKPESYQYKAMFADYFNCVDEECKEELEHRPPVPEEHQEFIDKYAGDPVAWLMWLEDQAPKTFDRAEDGTPLDDAVRDYFGVRSDRANRFSQWPYV